MKGFVPTPTAVVDLMVEKLFRGRFPKPEDTVLDPGCGHGAFVDGVVRWCSQNQTALPKIVGIESDSKHVRIPARRFADVREIQIRRADFLRPSPERFDYVVANPPYVPITALTSAEREGYRREYRTARGRFDLYLLFFEQALRLLNPGGRLVFITPEKFLYVETAAPLRNLLRHVQVDEFHFLDEETFEGRVTYPLVTTVTIAAPSRPTRVVHRDGSTSLAKFDKTNESWLPAVRGVDDLPSCLTLADVCFRISCGIATGADSVYVVRDTELDPRLRKFAQPTIAGRQIAQGEPVKPSHSLLLPYSEDGRLLPEQDLGELGQYLSDAARRERLMARTCVARKPWYAFHENPPMRDVLRPKLLCKDISATSFFVVDREGRIVPRHSVYYIVPANPECLDQLAEYLKSPPAREWLHGHCQRAVNGFLRVQSHILKRLPLPESFEPFRRPEKAQRPAREAQPA